MSGCLVQKKWLQKVDSAIANNGSEKNERAGSLFYDIRPATIISSWRKNDAGLWSARAHFLVNDKVDRSFSFDVVAPTAKKSPSDLSESDKFYAIWRGRWELLSNRISPTRYGPGKGISIEYPMSGEYGVIFHNAGVVEVVIQDNTYRDWGTLYLSSYQFYWNSSLTDTVGKKVLCIKTKSIDVVTGVTMVDGSVKVTKERVSVIG